MARELSGGTAESAARDCHGRAGPGSLSVPPSERWPAVARRPQAAAEDRQSMSKARLKSTARRVLRAVAPRTRPAILMYHRIGSETFDPWGLAVQRDRFAEQVEWLVKNRAVLPLS